jgi:hypothetical protein
MDDILSESVAPFLKQPRVQLYRIPVGAGVPLGIERVFNSQLGIGGAYGSWGESYDNDSLQAFIAEILGEPLRLEERMDLASLGFLYRHHTPLLPPEKHFETPQSLRWFSGCATYGAEPGARFHLEDEAQPGGGAAR